ncbi:protein turtle isoform X2 [Parasteatoda tepidariorum]|uniref:protein turtle isoform X2 n=1 Tax=Parasteatoda tepidariorum TaxID=114398 RepID=UPI001C7199AC|nr:hemicentin-1 isoform X1 [Parasteatoda tepidariorum]XP_042895827.1 hemicentin-1 isoform X2 [Parasteatoda tepidariorum]
MEKKNIVCLCYLLCNFWIFVGLTARAPAPATNEQPWATILYTAVVRGKVALPCDISPPSADDSVVLILWYKGEDPAPIYTLDARRGTVEQARQSASTHLENRAYFNMINRPAFLQLDPVQEDDAGEYRCRVDFRKARTVNTVITLKVIVPPGEPAILDEEGVQVKGMIGPYNEGDSLLIICESIGGKPRPSVTWWREYSLLDDTYSFIPGDNLVRNELKISELKRHDLLAVLTCQASNNNITVPASTAITLDLNLKPVDVRIDPNRQPLSSGQEYEFTCIAAGSRPPAIITWWKSNKQLKNPDDKSTQAGDVTTSIFRFTPTVQDNNVHFSCRAHNPVIPGSAESDGWTLEIHYVPHVSLQLGSTFKKGEIQEGNDVYFECNIHANPWITEVSWYFKGQELRTNTSAGIVISNQSLVLQKVQRTNRGLYYCMATNTEGTGRSNEVFLRIRYAPECKPNQKKIYGVALFETVGVTCELDADPENITFRWRFNSSGKSLDLGNFKTFGSKSTVSYRPHTDDDYGSIVCWGSNDVGRQREPCVFTIIPAGPPEPLQNCTVVNYTEDSLQVECIEGYNGGLMQVFQLEVYDDTGRKLHGNFTSLQPQFYVSGLPSGKLLRLVVFAKNNKGKSSPIVMAANTLQKPEKLTGMQGMIIFRPVLGLLIGIIIALILVAVVIIIYLRVKKQRKDKVTKRTPENPDKCQTPLKKDTDDIADSEEKGPDIIPANINTRQHFIVNEDPKDQVSPAKAAGTVCHWGSPPRNPCLESMSVQQCAAFRRQEDVTYAELALPLDQQTAATMTVRRKDPPTEYAKLDLQRHIHPSKCGASEEDEEISCTSCDTPLMKNKRESAV